jgi:hypothetical protein
MWMSAGVEIYTSKIAAYIYKASEWGEDTDVTFYRQPSVFLNGCLHIIGHSGSTLWNLLWIWRKTDGGKLIGLVVFDTSCIKLRVTCVYVLLLVPMIASFQSRSLKTMVLIIGHWSIRSVRGSCLEGLILDLVAWIGLPSTQWLQFAQNGIWFFCWGGWNNHRIWHGP